MTRNIAATMAAITRAMWSGASGNMDYPDMESAQRAKRLFSRETQNSRLLKMIMKLGQENLIRHAVRQALIACCQERRLYRPYTPDINRPTTIRVIPVK
jgi:hypothetical protein